MADVRHLQRICKDAFSAAGAVQETCSSGMLRGEGADFLRWVAFWSTKSVGLLWSPCVTGAALRMTWHQSLVAGTIFLTGGVEKSQNALVRGRQLCTQLSIFEERLAELLRFWRCQLLKLRKSCRVVSFLRLSSSKSWRHLAESLRFWCCQVQKSKKSRRINAFFQKLRKSRRIAAFSSLQIDRRIDRLDQIRSDWIRSDQSRSN